MANRKPTSAVNLGNGRDPLRALMRFVFAVPLAVLLCFIGLVGLSWTGWGTETDPMEQLRRDAAWLLVAAAAGASAGTLVAWGIAGKRWLWIALAAAVGLVPSVVIVTAYFTDTY